ncbi:nucleoid-associated protein [Shewanella sp. C32]|uniref:Nucleoid-associated protein n=1 Tax=Shewanella electrica TaxID=515560 RepID=A0ABT2FT21_9GAMM|nr:nucleoid-associated protein [Shewanella electrica]MCH1926803.1 nucleoid-associated protein [Shewanella electrica]MCS4558364.1 nucleoid-associated protein [Shewanella electrica]
MNTTAETRKLVSALESFADEQTLASEERGAFLDRAYQHISEMPKNTPIDLKALANASWPNDPDLLTAVFTRDDYALSDGFIPDRRVSRALVNFMGKSQFWTLNFSREAIKSGHVQYNESLNQIILTNIPAELSQELRTETRTSEDDDI